ncbi:MAG: hypothetical protein DRQ49_13655 [Gammaproteobacteria bacterium]|nr:MAG: hypothetical protein DRQ49_13655 [Gammaproteobacteria bacterium]RKZ38677.1 MAG: hypothetical protein DRQ41_11710 [Gammaproteobacteria bacterium]RKZ71644.1 MAG: hypothetical protein DRQ57_18390 [Gammaproteobacteria bacterium]
MNENQSTENQSTEKNQIAEIELMRMATDMALTILNKAPMYRGVDDSNRMLSFAMKTFDHCASTVASNYKHHFLPEQK